MQVASLKYCYWLLKLNEISLSLLPLSLPVKCKNARINDATTTKADPIKINKVTIGYNYLTHIRSLPALLWKNTPSFSQVETQVGISNSVSNFQS